MTHYAIRWHYGRAVDGDGDRCGSYWAFHCRTSRNLFCRLGPAYSTAANYREPIAAADPELRRLLRAQGGKPGGPDAVVRWAEHMTAAT